jgi:hypothetical protein
MSTLARGPGRDGPMANSFYLRCLEEGLFSEVRSWRPQRDHCLTLARAQHPVISDNAGTNKPSFYAQFANRAELLGNLLPYTRKETGSAVRGHSSALYSVRICRQNKRNFRNDRNRSGFLCHRADNTTKCISK